MEIIVNAMGMACPLPVVNAKKAMEEFSEDGAMIVLVDNEIAVQNLTKFGTSRGCEVTSEKKAEKEFAVTIQVKVDAVAAASEQEIEEEIIEETDSRKHGMIVVLSSNEMGNGDPKLGRTLMKAFVFALTKQDVLPETILCYNTGAYLTCQDADTLEDLKILEEAGVEIKTCGTCLDFYGLKETLAVGSVTNMYDIVETMEKAKQVIRP